MKARCITCKEMWSISWRRKITKAGYECPCCSQKKKKSPKKRAKEIQLTQI